MNSIDFLTMLATVPPAQEGDLFTLSISTLITGLVVVFVVLMLLVFTIKIFGMIVYGSGNRKKGKAQKTFKSSAAKTVSASPVTQSQVSAGIPNEVIAAISAAVAFTLDGNYSIKSIRKSKTTRNARPAWSLAGLFDNTRPF